MHVAWNSMNGIGHVTTEACPPCALVQTDAASGMLHDSAVSPADTGIWLALKLVKSFGRGLVQLRYRMPRLERVPVETTPCPTSLIAAGPASDRPTKDPWLVPMG
jgi:hypothetical protein